MAQNCSDMYYSEIIPCWLSLFCLTLTMVVNIQKRKIYPCNSQWRPIGFCDFKAPTFLDSLLTDGDKVVSLMCQLPFSPQEYSWYSFLLEVEPTPGP
jgi:hypothetical protein